jgi:hypothetical protein
MGMTLRDGNREHFYKKLDENFPGLKEKYITHFKSNYEIPSPYNAKLMKIFIRKTSKAKIMNNNYEIFKYLFEFPKREKTIQSKLF